MDALSNESAQELDEGMGMKGILLIAEDSDIAQSFTEILSPTYDVRNVSSTQEGFEALKNDYANIAAVLVELDLVRKDGFIITDHMQEYSSFSSVPLIAITNSTR